MVGAAATHQPALLWAIIAIDAPISHTLVTSMLARHRDGQRGAANERLGIPHQLGRGLALHLLALATSGPWTIATDERGKPIAVGGVERQISISHTGSFVAAAVSAIGPVGIDIERRDRSRDVVSLATAAFGRAEAAEVAVEGATAFYRIWTLREAISKATGAGFPAAVDRIDRVPARMTNGIWVEGDGNWLMAHDVLDEDTSLAIAIQSNSDHVTAAMRETNIASSRIKIER